MSQILPKHSQRDTGLTVFAVVCAIMIFAVSVWASITMIQNRTGALEAFTEQCRTDGGVVVWEDPGWACYVNEMKVYEFG